MEAGRRSGTAQGAAMLRAAHQLFDDPLVLDDPLALAILGGDARRTIEAAAERLQMPERRSLRAFVVARSRYAEDRLAEAVGRGTAQLVVLGAGLDTLAYRHPHGERLRVFEVDHPTTQAAKRDRLRAASIRVPRSVAFVPVDFERQELAVELERAGLRREAAVFFSWLGVTAYLTRPAAMDTLRFVASRCAKGSEIVLSFAASRSSVADRAAALGEPWLTVFDPASFACDVRCLGFTDVEHVGPDALNRLYFAGRPDGLRVVGGANLMRARV